MRSELYCDGGVIGKNPSPVAGTWAYRHIQADAETRQFVVVRQYAGIVQPREARMETISNNLTELLALLRGLQTLPADWQGTIYSDSQVTLGRVFEGWKWTRIPGWMHQIYQEQRARLESWNMLQWCLLDGHPTKAELAEGMGHRGHPVSVHNVWCDWACGEVGRRFQARDDLISWNRRQAAAVGA